MRQPGAQILLQAGDNRLIVPAHLGEKALEGSGRHWDHLGQILGAAAFLGLNQQGLEIMPAVFPPLYSAEGRGEEGVEVTEIIVNPLKLGHLHLTPPTGFTQLKKYLTPYTVVVILGKAR